jgi:hypothetical protein
MTQSNNVLLPRLVTFDGQGDFWDDVRHVDDSYNEPRALSVSFGAKNTESEAGLHVTMKDDFSHSDIVCFSEPKIRSKLGQTAGLSLSILAWALVSLFLLTETGAGTASRGENIADAAEKLLGDIRETHYQHKTYVVQSAGIYDMDCSGFVDFLLRQVAPEQYVRVPIEPGHARPRAAMFFELLNALPGSNVPGWKAVDRLADAQRGDIIAWALTASTRKPGDTGHVVIVAAPPVPANLREYRIAVYDSSGIRHDDDSRPETTSGIGKGVIIVKVDDRGAPIGFQFNSHAHFHREPIAVGRIIN